MADKKQPTNADLYKELKHMSGQINGMDARLISVEKVQFAEKVAKTAVDEYKRKESVERTVKIRTEVMQKVIYVLGLLGVALYAYLSSRGIQP